MMRDIGDQLDRLIAHATSDDLIRALAKRGAITRPLADGTLKVTLKLQRFRRGPGRPRGSVNRKRDEISLLDPRLKF